MPLRYVLDEHLRGPLFHAVQAHNRLGVYPLDVTQVGDPADLPLGTLDPLLLEWAERETRVLVTVDKNTIVGHLAAHLAASRYSPGVFLILPRSTIPELVEFLVDAGYASDFTDWENAAWYIP